MSEKRVRELEGDLALLEQALASAVERVQAREVTAALLLIDLDRFQSVNRLVGYTEGNDLLRAVGERLRTVAPEGSVLGRQGEDEFLLIVTVPTASQQPPNAAILARDLAQQVLASLAQPFPVQGHPLLLSATIGISTAPGDASTAEELQEHADSALHQAKSSGRGRFLFYSREMAEHTERKQALEQELARALERGEFRVLYQPVVELAKGHLVGAAAQLAWDHPQRGPQVPEEFLPVAEQSGLIVPLGNWFLAQACDQISRLKTGFVTVKLSTRQLLDPGLGSRILAAVQARRIKPESLVLTISEATLSEVPERFDTLVSQAAQGGLPLALSQTGTEHFSLRRLQSRAVAYLRVARWIVDGVLHDENCASLCRTLLAMARELNLRTLAEGADSAEQVRFLALHGCDLACGAWFKKPVSGDELVKLKRQVWKVSDARPG